MAATFSGCPVSRLCFLGHTAASLLLSPAFKRDLAFNLGRTLARGEARGPRPARGPPRPSHPARRLGGS